jgi:hypothetical protein
LDRGNPGRIGIARGLENSALKERVKKLKAGKNS